MEDDEEIDSDEADGIDEDEEIDSDEAEGDGDDDDEPALRRIIRRAKAKSAAQNDGADAGGGSRVVEDRRFGIYDARRYRSRRRRRRGGGAGGKGWR